MGDLDELKLKLREKNGEIDNLHMLVQKIQDDKIKMSKKISKLLENGKKREESNPVEILFLIFIIKLEKELVQELDSLKGNKRANSGGRSKTVKNGSNLTVKLDSYIKNIESERDFFKREVDTLNELLKSVNPTRSSSSSHTSPHKSRKEIESKVKRSLSHSPGANRCSVCHSSIGKNKSPSPSSSRHQQKSILKSPSRNSFVDDPVELSKVLKERDELKCLLDKFERHMSEVK